MERWLTSERIRRIAKEEGLGELSDDEVEFVRKMILKSMAKIANEET